MKKFVKKGFGFLFFFWEIKLFLYFVILMFWENFWICVCCFGWNLNIYVVYILDM